MINTQTIFTPEELHMMDYWIEHYAKEEDGEFHERTPIDEILGMVWAKSKENLFKVFGEKLIITKPIKLSTSRGDIERAIKRSESYQKFTSAFWNRVDSLAREVENPCTWLNEYGRRTSTLEIVADFCLSAWGLAENRYEYHDTHELPMPDGHTIKLQNGTKLTRVLGKVSEAFGIPYFEEFRIEHSQILNKVVDAGELCLSIHPLDFMTLSDNDNNWSSCMSWRNRGCYRRGTVEMMNSPLVVVAYIKSEHDMTIGGEKWNNKRWRQLIVCSKEAIMSVKAYPYSNGSYSDAAITWLAELFNQNAGTDYDISNKCEYDYENDHFYADSIELPLEMVTDTMYNDFGCDVMHHIICDRKYFANPIYREINYSGQEQCMICGGFVFDLLSGDDYIAAEYLVCGKCGAPDAVCSHCGAQVQGESLTLIDDEFYCPCCIDSRTAVDPFTQERHSIERYARVYMGEGKFGGRIFRYLYPYFYTERSNINSEEWLKIFPEVTRIHDSWLIDIDYVDVTNVSDEDLARFGVENREIFFNINDRVKTESNLFW